MLNKIIKKFSENTRLHVLIVFFSAVITFFPTSKFFFYLDEWGALYEFTHKPYQFGLFTTNNYYLLYKLFGLNAAGYYSAGILIYALSVVLFYFFARYLFKNKLMGLVAGLLYATTPVGTNTATMIWTYVAEGGYPMGIMLLLCLYSLLKYLRERKLIYFALSALGFAYFLDLEPRRVFLFVPILFLLDWSVSAKKFIPSAGFFVRQAVFLGIFIAYYNYDVTITEIVTKGQISVAHSTLGGDAKLDFGIQALTHIKPFVSLTNVLLGGPWILIAPSLNGYVDIFNPEHMHSLAIFTTAVALGLIVLSFKVKREWGFLNLFALGWVYSNVMGFYIFSSPGVSDTVHRTLSIAAPGYALFFTISGFSLYTFFKQKKWKSGKFFNRAFLFLLVAFTGINMLASHYNFNKQIVFQGIPAKNFFKNLKSWYPTLPKNSIIYIDTPRDVHIRYQLSRIYGGNPYGNASSIAAFYPEIKKEELLVLTNFVEVENLVEKDPSYVDRVFGFYFDKTGLQNKTEEIRQKLTSEF